MSLTKSICLAVPIGLGSNASEALPVNKQIDARLLAEGQLRWNGGSGTGAGVGAGTDKGFFGETNTTWVRIWADWCYAHGGDDGTVFNSTFLVNQLDQEIRAANAREISVLLVAKRTANLPGVRDLPGEPTNAPFGEARYGADYQWPTNPAIAEGGPWYEWIRFLSVRYHPDPVRRKKLFDELRAKGISPFKDAPPLDTTDGGPHITALEFVNEPNLESGPQRTTGSGPPTVAAERVFNMFVSAKAIADEVNAEASPRMTYVGPGTADWDNVDSDEERSSVDDFLRALFAGKARQAALAAIGNDFVFSQHCYTDGEDERTAGPRRRKGSKAIAAIGRADIASVNHVAWTEAFLKERGWGGRRRGGGPIIWLTEGGIRRDQMLLAPKGDAKQPSRLQELEAELKLLRLAGKRPTCGTAKARKNPVTQRVCALDRELKKLRVPKSIENAVAAWAIDLEREQARRLRNVFRYFDTEVHGVTMFTQFLSWPQANESNSCDLAINPSGRRWSPQAWRQKSFPADSVSSTNVAKGGPYAYKRAKSKGAPNGVRPGGVLREAFYAWKKL